MRQPPCSRQARPSASLQGLGICLLQVIPCCPVCSVHSQTGPSCCRARAWQTTQRQSVPPWSRTASTTAARTSSPAASQVQAGLPSPHLPAALSGRAREQSAAHRPDPCHPCSLACVSRASAPQRADHDNDSPQFNLCTKASGPLLLFGAPLPTQSVTAKHACSHAMACLQRDPRKPASA